MNFEYYFTKDYTGAPFHHFGLGHILAMGTLLAIVLLLGIFGKQWSQETRDRVRIFFAVSLAIIESTWHIWSIYYGIWSIQTNLPLHVCSVFTWASVIMLFTKNQYIFEMTFFLGFGGAIPALITPDAGMYGFPHFRAFQTFGDHGGIIIAVMFMILVEGYRPWPKSFIRLFIFSNIYLPVVFVINQLIGSNYIFLAHKPEFPSIIDYLSEWPWYILQLELIGITVAAILYIPFLVKDLAASKRKRES